MGGNDNNCQVIIAEAYNIDKNNNIIFERNVSIKKVNNLLSDLYDKRKFEDDTTGIVCAMDGTEGIGKKIRINPIFNKNILGYIISKAFGFENPGLTTNLLRCAQYDGNGFYLREDNYLEKLPLFVAGKYYITDDWVEFGTIYKTSDGKGNYLSDKDFLKSCFIYTCLCYYNRCRSFTGYDRRYYRNELCFDTTNGDTVASKDLKTMILDADEQTLIVLWDKILQEAKNTKNYDPKLTYGVYQITKELNTKYKVIKGNHQWIPDYPVLNGDLETLKVKLKEYYKTHITEKMFKYELLK